MVQNKEAAVKALKAGKPVIFPTDTVFGVGVSVKAASGPDVLYDLKKREARKPIAWLVGSVDDLTEYGKAVPDGALAVARTFWPGPLTLVVKASDKVPAAFRSAQGTIGLRMPADECARALIEAAGCPIATTSANTAGYPAPQRFDQLDEGLKSQVGAVLDDNEEHSGISSTVLDCTQEHPVVLREGAITISDIRARS